MRLPVILSLTLAAASCLHAEAPPIQGTLPEDLLPGLKPLLSRAVERSPSTISASIQLAAAEASEYGSAAALWPHLSASASYLVSDESISQGATSTARGFNYGLSLNQP